LTQQRDWGVASTESGDNNAAFAELFQLVHPDDAGPKHSLAVLQIWDALLFTPSRGEKIDDTKVYFIDISHGDAKLFKQLFECWTSQCEFPQPELAAEAVPPLSGVV
jgi:hypothetical protein